MRSPGLAMLACALTLAAGCTTNARADASGQRTLTVTATDSSCHVSSATAPAGTVTFAVTNNGTSVTEFYLLAADGLRIVAEVENIGPGITRDLVLTASPGTYFTACKPGMTGDGIRAGFTVSDTGQSVGPTGADAELVATANSQYAAYVRDQVDQLVTATKTFTDAYAAGRDDEARTQYATARVHWERIEPVAESFGDLDPKMDAREADLTAGEAWTGWHRIEKDLWPQRAASYTPLTRAERKTLADDLVANTAVLYDRTQSLTFTADAIANGAKSLLDEVATGKVTGEEEYWSRTDLYDFQANVDGARVAWLGLQPVLQRKDGALDAQLSARFAELQALLDTHKGGTGGFVTYDTLTSADVKALSDAVNALGEPLSKMAAAVLG